MEKEKHIGEYDDIIDLPHYVSPTRPQMAIGDRAAQFSPFAALTGYEAAVEESGRLTEAETELTEDEKAVINERIGYLKERMTQAPAVRVTYFVPDRKKEGGAYVTVEGNLNRIDEFERCLWLSDGTRIPVDQIQNLEGDSFLYRNQ